MDYSLPLCRWNFPGKDPLLDLPRPTLRRAPRSTKLGSLRGRQLPASGLFHTWPCMCGSPVSCLFPPSSPPVSPLPLPLQPGSTCCSGPLGPSYSAWSCRSGAGVCGLAGGWEPCSPPREVAPSLQLKRDKRGPTAAGGLWGHSGPPRSRAAPLGCGGSDRPPPPDRGLSSVPPLLQAAAPQLHSVGRALGSLSSWGSPGGRGGHTVPGSPAPSRGDPEKSKSSLGQRRPESGLGSARPTPAFTIRVQGLRSSDPQCWPDRPLGLVSCQQAVPAVGPGAGRLPVQ